MEVDDDIFAAFDVIDDNCCNLSLFGVTLTTAPFEPSESSTTAQPCSCSHDSTAQSSGLTSSSLIFQIRNK